MKPHVRIFRSFLYFLLSCLLMSALLLSGCASDNVCRYIPDKPIFFPPPPDEPHIQYLTGINSSDDIGERKKQSSFSLVVSGKEQPEVINKLGKAYGITAYRGKLYLAEGLEKRISIIDPVKGTFETVDGANNPKGGLKYPVNVTLDDAGNLYVADTGRREVVVFDSRGNFKKSFGKEFGPKSKITDVKVYKGKLYVCDFGSNLIRVLDPVTGEQQAEFGSSENLQETLALPNNFDIDAEGNLYVANIATNKVVKLDQDGNFLGSFGGAGDRYGQFSKPKGVALDNNKRIYVVDSATSLVQLFDDKFINLSFFGYPGLPAGSLSSPAGIAVTSDYVGHFQKFAAPGFKLETLIFVVSQFGQEFCVPRISVYGLGQMEKKEDK
jgi:DNA-binding beta-propeller fold protein YncE